MEQLQTRLDVLEHQLQTLTYHTYTITRRLRWWRGLACGLVVLAGLTWALPLGTAQEDAVTASEKEKKGLEQRVAALESLLKHFSRKGNDVFITKANLHLVNGLGQTDCGTEEVPIPDCPNGLGNLIVGYNELRDNPFVPDVRTGSHNVVVGQQHNFSRFGGLVVGSSNTISGDFAVVSGGQSNLASGPSSSVSGGQLNTASGRWSAVSGGQSNTASGGEAAAVSGGFGNTASELWSAVSGGLDNTASGLTSTVSGGQNNTASGVHAVVSGGTGNTASNNWSVVSGGQNNTASGEAAAVSGGAFNTASGNFSSVSGGGGLVIVGEDAVGLGNTASGDVAVVSGGQLNTASGFGSTVSGGQNRTAEGEFDWVAGSLFEDD